MAEAYERRRLVEVDAGRTENGFDAGDGAFAS
jgi:hypothetical protein